MMERQVNMVARLVDDLLDVSRITLSQIELRKAPLDVVDLVRRVTEQHGPWAERKQHSVHVVLPREPLYIEGDEVRIEQIIDNLLDNASKYTNNGGEIWVSVERAAGDQAALAATLNSEHVVIRVRDNGIGIAADKLRQVFDPFMRAAGSNEQHYAGLGVGLTLVRRLAELHGGGAEAHSAGLGQGSEFVVRLPLAHSAADVSVTTEAKSETK